MKIVRSIGVLACGAALLAGAVACTDDSQSPQPRPTAAAGIETDSSALVNLGIEQGESGDLEKAKESFEQAVASDSGNKFAWFNIGYIAHSQDQIDDAIASYDKALAIDPEFKPAIYNKAIAIEASDAGSAIDLYKEILALDNRASTAYVRLGILLASEGDTAGARSAFGAAVEINPELVPAIPEEYREHYLSDDD
ncbi:tetratricopeptide repeat protein [Solwaraspora sp. WMMD406]|uniref:tetratricopeptide repeat protein n=1 Tax=Solwaraspora sp. WMMD406 TaxID=3016095 RepID=UPI0024165E35|nr:tetratricopeptide repeat protein [Solwaraspora sp. WMMD406]MDG4763911.1 tetratricopeptide repeat protein [Solwaraspora sp. WMMD406]